MSKPAAEPLLEVSALEAGYGLARVLEQVSINVGAGEVVALVGRNGAGKSTLLRTISGLLAPSRGDIRFAGRAIGGLRAEERARLGIAHVPEGRGIFPSLSVRENLALGAFGRAPGGRRVAGRARDAELLESVLLLFPWMRARLREPAGVLSGGQQQMVAIARGLIAAPRLMLLDEPSLGLAPRAAREVFEHLLEVRKHGLSMVLVEERLAEANGLASRGYVMSHGRIVFSGTVPELMSQVGEQAYLGVAPP